MTDRELLREARDVIARLSERLECCAIRAGSDPEFASIAVEVERDFVARIDAALAAEDATIPRAPRDATTC